MLLSLACAIVSEATARYVVPPDAVVDMNRCVDKHNCVAYLVPRKVAIDHTHLHMSSQEQ